MKYLRRWLWLVPFIIFCLFTCLWALIKAPYDFLRGEYDWIDFNEDCKHFINGGRR